MPIIVGISTFMSRKKSCSAELSMNIFYNLKPEQTPRFAKSELDLNIADAHVSGQ